MEPLLPIEGSKWYVADEREYFQTCGGTGHISNDCPLKKTDGYYASVIEIIAELCYLGRRGKEFAVVQHHPQDSLPVFLSRGASATGT